MNIRELPRQIFDELATARPEEVTEALVAEFTNNDYRPTWEGYWSQLDRPALIARVGEAAMILEEKTTSGENYEDEATTRLIVYPSRAEALANPIDSQCGHLVARIAVRSEQSGVETLINAASILYSNDKIESLMYSQKQPVLTALGAMTSRMSELYTKGEYSNFSKSLNDL